MRWLLHELSRNPKIELQVIALGPHLSPAFGNTVKNIRLSKEMDFSIEHIECLLDSDTDVGMAKTIGVATLSFADALSRLRPDVLVLIADRYEMLAPACRRWRYGFRLSISKAARLRSARLTMPSAMP